MKVNSVRRCRGSQSEESSTQCVKNQPKSLITFLTLKLHLELNEARFNRNVLE